MKISQVFSILYDKEKKDVWDQFLIIEQNCEYNNELYHYYNDIKTMLMNEKSYVRLRGFILICRLSKWDKDKLINNDINIILSVLDDEKGSIVRMCLSRIGYLLKNKIELKDIIKRKIMMIDLSKYKESMRSLIKKDIDNIINDYF